MQYYKLYCSLSDMDEEISKRAESKLLLLDKLSEARNRNDLNKAEQIAQNLTLVYKNDPDIWYILSQLYLQQHLIQKSAYTLLNAVRYDKNFAPYHYAFGELFSQLDLHHDIFRAYIYALDIEEDILTQIELKDAHDDLLLTVIYKYKQLIKCDGIAEHYINLGNILIAGHHIPSAIEAYQDALKLDSMNRDAYRNLAFAFRLQGDIAAHTAAMGDVYYVQSQYDRAIDYYNDALSRGDCSSSLYHRLASSYSNLGRYADTIAICQKGLALFHTKEFYVRWARALQRMNRIDEALQVVDRARIAFPDDTFFKFPIRLMLPSVYQSETDLTVHRLRFSHVLEQWIEACETTEIYVKDRAIQDIQHTNFSLAYQGKNDLQYQKKYGHLLNRIMRASYPQWSGQKNKRPQSSSNRIRVGYLSAFCYWHTVGKLFLGWLQHHDADQVEVFTYHIGTTADFMTRLFDMASSRFFHFPSGDLQAICKQIDADQLDILVFFECGMDVLTSQLANLRLAPTQCVAWGHPVTTGFPTIDYFLSSEGMEPENGSQHYSETLVRLPHIGVSVPPPYVPTSSKVRSDFGLDDTRIVYISPQSVFKYLPQYDGVFADIASQVSRSQFVFIERSTHSLEAAESFKARLQVAFRERGLDPNAHIHFLPSQPFRDYMRLYQLADVYLDSIEWSGGITTLEALGCALPVATLPGAFMRGRHSYACLERLGLRETIASSVDDYVGIAACLGLEREWRSEIVSKLSRSLPLLYDDRACVLALEQFYRDVVH